MAAVGSAVGLGNLWSFPYKVGSNGGAAFIFIYVIIAVIVGVVALIGELIIGKRSQSNVINTFSSISPKSKWLGYLGVIVPFLILCYYPVIGGWAVKYAVDYIGGIGVAVPGVDAGEAFGAFITSGGMPVLYLFIFLAIVTIIVLLGVKKGIEMASKILMPMLFICLIVVIGIGLSLPNAIEGVKYLFVPDFSLVTGGTILTAMGQVFFSMSLGMGINIAYGSYMGETMSVGSNAVIVSVMDTVMALLAGLAIFPAVFSFGLSAKEGPSLLFDVLATVFGSMGAMGRVFGAIFFILVIVAAVTSSIALLEVPVQFLVEKFHLNRKVVSLGVALTAFAAATVITLSFGTPSLQVQGQSLLDVFDTVINKIILPVTALSTCLLIGWKIKPKYLMNDLGANTNIKRKVYNIWGFLIKFITPTAIFSILMFGLVDLFSGNVKEFPLLAGQLIVFFVGLSVIIVALLSNYVSRQADKKIPCDAHGIPYNENEMFDYDDTLVLEDAIN